MDKKSKQTLKQNQFRTGQTDSVLDTVSVQRFHSSFALIIVRRSVLTICKQLINNLLVIDISLSMMCIKIDGQWSFNEFWTGLGGACCQNVTR